MIDARRMARVALLAILATQYCGCAVPAKVVISGHYNPARIRTVALAGFQDYLNAAGSGSVAAGIFEKYLLLAGYKLVERAQAAKLLQDQGVTITDSIDLATLRKLGEQLGVDAVAIGQLDDFTETSDRSVVEDMPLEQSQPILGTVERTERVAGVKTVVQTNEVTGYAYSQTHVPVQQTETVPAHAGISVRLVDVMTGEVLWVGSASCQGSHINEALDEASSEVMKAVSERLKGLQNP